jgi:PAS domain S-box-containing protein
MFIVWGPQRTLIYNDAYAQILAEKHPVALGRPFLEVWSEIADELAPYVEQAYAGHSVYMDHIALMIRRHGRDEEAHFAFSYSPVRNDDQSVGGFLCACSETTDRVISERQHRKTQERLQVSLSIRTIAFIYWDANLAIADTNQAFLEMTGFSKYEALGKTWQELTPTEFWPASEQAVRQLVETGEAVPYEKQYYRKDGSLWWGHFAPKKVGDGAMEFVIDITERKMAEAQLREREQSLQLIIDTIPTGLIMLDERGTMVLENDEWKRIWAGNALLDAIVDYGSYKGFRPETGERITAEEWPCAISLKQGTRTRDIILDIERFDGTRGTVVVSSAPIRNEAGRVVGAIAANMDISELRAAQSQLLEADRRKDEFLAMLSHELRNPLAPIRNSLYILDRADPSGQQARNAREVIGRHVTHLTKLVDDLLDVTRIAKGKIALHRTSLDVAALVRRTAEDYSPLTHELGLELVVVVGDDTLMVEGDETRLSQVLGNLLGNAVKFTPSGGRITLTASRRSDRVIIQVADNGAGIAAELLPIIFEPFTQASQGLARTEGGLGLGLAFVKSLTELHGGIVTVESTPGTGAEFKIDLPIAPDAQSAALQVTTNDIDHTTQSRAVLIVDDNADSADSLAAIAEMLGHLAEVAYDGRTAIGLAGGKDYDVVLCDIGLPDVNGYDVARTLRKKLPAATRLIAISGYAQPEDVAKALAAGFDAHFAKPLDMRHIQQVFAGAA